jgi:hemoglobin/transferrin/lactoferrin receptor protein
MFKIYSGTDMLLLHKLLLIFLLITPQIFGQNNRIFGVVKDEQPINNVNIAIDELALTTFTDKNGSYSFSNIPNGRYTLIFSYLGYKERSEDVEIKNGQKYELNIILAKSIIQIGEIQVTSSRSEQIVKDVSLPLEYISQSQIENTPNNTISDLLNKESGLSVVKDGPWATTVNIRGLGKQNIVYLINGSRIETSTNIAAGLSLMDMNDIESVEVVKSGLSSLYGTGATGGVINIKTKDAGFNENIYFSSQLINGYNSVNNSYSNYLNIRTGSNNWSAKLNGSFRKADDTETPEGKLENSSFRDESLNASFKYIPIENLILNIDYQKFAGYDVGIPGGDPFPKNALAKYKYARRQLIDASVEYKNITSYLLKTKLKFYQQLVSRSVELRPNPMATANPVADHTTNGMLFQTDWFISKTNYLVAGIDAWQREYEGTRTSINKAKNVISVDKPVPNSKFRSIGIFAKDEISLMENKLNLSLSGRYDFINITNEKTNNPVSRVVNGNPIQPTPDPLASYDAYDENNKSVSGGIGAVYKFYTNLDFTFNFGYNFRSPSLEERYQFIDLGGIVYLGNPKLQPEEGTFFDAGFRIWENDLSFRINGFFNKFSNLVVDDILIPDSIFVKENIGEARLYGFDARLDFNFYDDYLVYANAAYVRGEDLTKNENLPQISPFNGLLGVVIPITDLMKFDLSATFSSSQNNIGLGEDKTGGFTYYDVKVMSNDINFGFLNFNVIGGVQNIFDRKYREHLSTYRGINNLEPGRNIFVKLILNFN